MGFGPLRPWLKRTPLKYDSTVFKFQVAADGPDPLVVQFEPMANEIVVSPGDHITIGWPQYDANGPGTFAYGPGRLTILEPNVLDGRWARVWNSAGEEITY